MLGDLGTDAGHERIDVLLPRQRRPAIQPRRELASCASTSSLAPKWVMTSRSGFHAAIRSIDSCHFSTSMSGGGLGGIVSESARS